jgi:hypothetical protein
MKAIQHTPVNKVQEKTREGPNTKYCPWRPFIHENLKILLICDPAFCNQSLGFAHVSPAWVLELITPPYCVEKMATGMCYLQSSYLRHAPFSIALYQETTHVHQNFKRIAGRYWPTLRFGHRAIAKTDDLGPGVAPWVSLTPKGALNASSPSAHVLQKSRPRLKVLMVFLNVHEASGNKGFLNEVRYKIGKSFVKS